MKIGSLLLFQDNMFIVIGGEFPIWRVFSLDMPGTYHIDVTEEWYTKHFTLLLE